MSEQTTVADCKLLPGPCGLFVDPALQHLQLLPSVVAVLRDGVIYFYKERDHQVNQGQQTAAMHLQCRGVQRSGPSLR